MSDPFWGTESEPRIGVNGHAADGLRKRTHSGIATSAGHLRDGCLHPRSGGQRHRLDGLASKHSHTDHATTPTDTRQPPAADVQRRHAAAYARVRVRLVHFGLLDYRPECWHALMCPRYTSPSHFPTSSKLYDARPEQHKCDDVWLPWLASGAAKILPAVA